MKDATLVSSWLQLVSGNFTLLIHHQTVTLNWKLQIQIQNILVSAECKGHSNLCHRCKQLLTNILFCTRF